MDQECEYNNMFNRFVGEVFGYELRDMLPTVQYCATYFELGYTFEKPMLEEDANL